MKFQMFFEFPGVLITIGALLLIISIIIIIIAYRSGSKDVDASKLSTNGLYKSTISHDGYYDNGKPKIVIEQKKQENKELSKTKVFEPLKENKKENNSEMRKGIKDQIDKIPITEKPLFPKANKNTEVKEEDLPVIDAFEEEFKTSSKKELEKPKIIDAKEEDFINPRTVQTKKEVKTVIKDPVYLEDDEDVELL